MGGRAERAAVAAWLIAAAVACGNASFECSTDGQCDDGVCISPGFCAFPTDDCESGLQFGEHSSSDLAGMCVPMDDGTSTTATEVEGTDESTTTGEVPDSNSSGGDTLAADDEGAGSSGEEAIDCTQWWDLEWAARRALVAGSDALGETLADFPVPVPLDDLLLPGADLRFIGEDCTELAYDIELTAEGEPLVAWVRWPEFGPRATTIHAYYGNPDAEPGHDGPAVWDDGYRAVWHLSTTADATGAHGLTTGEVIPEVGQLGMAQRFDGVDDSIQSAAAPSLAFDDVTAFSVSGWVRVDGLPMPLNDRVIDKSESTDSQYGFAVSMQVNDTQLLEIDFNRGGEGGEYRAQTVGANLELGTWHHFGVSYDPPLDAVIVVNGAIYPVDVLAAAGDPLSDADTPITLGAAPYTNNRFLDGAIDELRLSTVARSADWHIAEYLAAIGDLVTIGEEEAAPL